MKELWKDVIGHEGLYQVSNYGRIKSLARKVQNKGNCHNRKECIYKLVVDQQGYYKFNMKKNGVCHWIRVHRLVAETFLPKIEGRNVVNHLDGNKLNNHISNYEWCTQPENLSHAHKIGLCTKGEESNLHKLTEQEVIAIRSTYKFKVITAKMLADRYDVKVRNIWAILSRKTWKHVA